MGQQCGQHIPSPAYFVTRNVLHELLMKAAGRRRMKEAKGASLRMDEPRGGFLHAGAPWPVAVFQLPRLASQPHCYGECLHRPSPRH